VVDALTAHGKSSVMVFLNSLSDGCYVRAVTSIRWSVIDSEPLMRKAFAHSYCASWEWPPTHRSHLNTWENRPRIMDHLIAAFTLGALREFCQQHMHRSSSSWHREIARMDSCCKSQTRVADRQDQRTLQILIISGCDISLTHHCFDQLSHPKPHRRSLKDACRTHCEARSR